MNNSLEDGLKETKTKHWLKSRPYSEVREYIKNYKFETLADYQNWVRYERAHGRHLDFPIHPKPTYMRRNEWTGVKHFLGKIDYIPLQKSQETHNTKQMNVGWRIIAQIFGLGKDKQHA